MIYFISDGSAIKIGYTKNVSVRINKLQGASSRPLKLLKTIHGNIARERELHAQFSHIRLSNEWFKPAPELTEYIDGQPWGNSHQYRVNAPLSEVESTPPREVVFSRNLEAAICSRGWTKSHFSRIAGINKSILNDWIVHGSNPRKLDDLDRTARTLGLTIEELCFGDVEACLTTK